MFRYLKQSLPEDVTFNFEEYRFFWCSSPTYFAGKVIDVYFEEEE